MAQTSAGAIWRSSLRIPRLSRRETARFYWKQYGGCPFVSVAGVIRKVTPGKNLIQGRHYSDTDAAAAGAAAGAAAAVFFIPGVAAWGPWAQATLGMKKTAAAAPAAAASVSE